MASSTGAAVVVDAVLPKQHFTGNPLERDSDACKRFTEELKPDSEISLVVVAGREVVVRPVAAGGPTGVHQELQALLLRVDDPELDLQVEEPLLRWTPPVEGADPIPLPLYLLGSDAQGRWTFALDISSAAQAFLQFLAQGCELEVALKDMRVLLPGLSLDAAAIAGQAAALSQWHQTHQFCPRCGAATRPCEAGARRRCLGTPSHKQYPRTDPVVIMLVESPDGQRALLGRSVRSTPGMYTCLSGFIDQCEGIEEAVRREVWEEALISVSEVHIVGTQPWPIGRYGSCELMIGCIAKATNYYMKPNEKEMEDAQWYDRKELLQAVQMYSRTGVPIPEVQKRSWATLGFFIPPPFAIAHHLIHTWASREDPWFPPASGGSDKQQQQGGAAAAADGDGGDGGGGGAANGPSSAL